MLKREELLMMINRDIPMGVDWKAGAQRYVATFVEKLGREGVEKYAMNKPFSEVGINDPAPAIHESIHYINNLANALGLLKPHSGSRILDVACGGGWVSHFLSKMGYWTYGIDISEDFIDLAARRLASDSTLGVTLQEAHSRFSVLDIEISPLPDELKGTFDYIWLESCLHHFVDPITALEHLVEALKPDGIIVLIEFENRQGAIKDEYLQVMKEFDTLERPYSRAQLVNALEIVGLHVYEFVGSINGWFSPSDPASMRINDILIDSAAHMNLAICSRQTARLNKMFPHRQSLKNILFGKGVYENENGYRWSGPSAEFQALKHVKNLAFEISSSLPRELERNQIVVAYSPVGEVGRVILTPEKPYGQLIIGDVALDMRITMHSIEAFCPSWTGSNDNRLLSFSIKTED